MTLSITCTGGCISAKGCQNSAMAGFRLKKAIRILKYVSGKIKNKINH